MCLIYTFQVRSKKGRLGLVDYGLIFWIIIAYDSTYGEQQKINPNNNKLKICFEMVTLEM